jgi:hypothetical protein
MITESEVNMYVDIINKYFIPQFGNVDRIRLKITSVNFIDINIYLLYGELNDDMYESLKSYLQMFGFSGMQYFISVYWI